MRVLNETQKVNGKSSARTLKRLIGAVKEDLEDKMIRSLKENVMEMKKKEEKAMQLIQYNHK